MSFCPEDGKEMQCTNSAISFAEYDCPECGTHWQYDAEEGCYRVIQPDDQIPESIADDGSIAVS